MLLLDTLEIEEFDEGEGLDNRALAAVHCIDACFHRETWVEQPVAIRESQMRLI